MKITNNNNLPKCLETAIKSMEYSGSGEARFCSVTDLIKPAFQLALQEKFKDEITEDISEKGWLFLGVAVHDFMEKANKGASGVLSEERLKIKVNNLTITGGVDIYDEDEKSIYDFKITSVWKKIFLDKNDPFGTFKEWQFQLNCYRLMYEEAGFEVNQLKIITFYRDFQESASKYKKQKNYPGSQIEVIDIPLMNRGELLKLIEQRAYTIEEARELVNEKYDVLKEEFANHVDKMCSDQVIWWTENKYAVMKKGRKTAVKLFDSSKEAEAFIILQPSKESPLLSIEHRRGVPKRCESYCSVAEFCPKYKYLQEKGVFS